MKTHFSQGDKEGLLPTNIEQEVDTSSKRLPGLSLGLLDEFNNGYPPTQSQDVLILRRLKLAILEGQHPYFRGNTDLSNLQDHVLALPISGNSSSADLPTALGSVLRTSTNLPGNSTSIGDQVNAVNQNNEKACKMAVDDHPDFNETKTGGLDQSTLSKESGSNAPAEFSKDKALSTKDAQSGAGYTLGRHTLLSPIQSEVTNHVGRGRSTSDASTVIEIAQQSTETIKVKSESPPHEVIGSQTLLEDPTSSSLASFSSAATMSTVLTSESGADTDTQQTDVDLSGYNPKYGNKVDYVRHQKARVKILGSTEGRKPTRSEDRRTKSPPRRATGPSDLSARGPEYVPKTNTLPPPSRTSSLNARETTSNAPRHGPTVDTAKDRLARPPSPRRAENTYSRPTSPPLGRYIPPQRPRDYSPSRNILPQYLPYDDPVPVPARPRPAVSSPPRGSPPRETPSTRAADRPGMDEYATALRRSETRSFDLRPANSSIFADRPSARDSGIFGTDRAESWGLAARGLSRTLLRDSPPHLEAARERTSFTSSSLPASLIAGYRPQAVSELSDTNRYTAPYDPTPIPGRRPELSWPQRDWPPEVKPKLQDRFTIEPTWPRDRDDFGSRTVREREGFRREPSPAYSDGLRSGFRRSSDIEVGMRPMKRSRPDDEYPSRGGHSGSEGARYDLDAQPLPPPGSDYYSRNPVRRPDDEYITRTRPPYGFWSGSPA